MKSARKLGHSLRLVATLWASLPVLAACAAPVLLGGALAACADENDPKTWVKRLGEKADRPAAIKQLHDVYFQKALSKAGNDREKPEVKAVLDDIAAPMAQTYIDLAGGGSEVEATRKELIKDLADLRDLRAAPAFAKALQSFEQGKNEDEVSSAVLGTAALAKDGKLADAAGNIADPNATKLVEALWDLFSKFEVSKAALQSFYTDLHDAILDVTKATKATNPYGDKALEKLQVDIKDNDDKGTRDNQQFWQGTSVQVISELRYPKAVRALLVAMLQPNKRLPLIYNPARTALLKMPKEAEPVVLAALRGTDADLKKLVEVVQKDKDGKVVTYKEDTTENGPDGKPMKDKVHKAGTPVMDKVETSNNLTALSGVLALISRPSGRDALLELMPSADPVARAAYAAALVDMPTPDKASQDKVKEAFLDAYKKADKESKKSLLPRVAQLYDPALVDFLIGEANGAELDMLMRFSALDAAMRLMRADQAKAVKDAIDKSIDKLKTVNEDSKKKFKPTKTDPKDAAKEKADKDKELDDQVKEVQKAEADSYAFTMQGLDACKAAPTDAMCYVKVLDTPIPSSPPNANMKAIKACWMAVIFGEKGDKSVQDAARAALVSHIDGVRNMLARQALALAVDELASSGDAAAADTFEKLIEKDKPLHDKELDMADDLVAKVAFRLRGRAAK